MICANIMNEKIRINKDTRGNLKWTQLTQGGYQ